MNIFFFFFLLLLLEFYNLLSLILYFTREIHLNL